MSPHKNEPRTAVVKGAGPSGLAAAITLAQEGFSVTIVEKRPARLNGLGRRNMVALRPEALRQLEYLGALKYAAREQTLTTLTDAKTINEWDSSVFVWPLTYYPAPDYQVPSKINEQVPSSFINLGHLEDHLARAAVDLDVNILYDSTIELQREQNSASYRVLLSEASGQVLKDLGIPDIVVAASGKGDDTLSEQLEFRRYIGVKLDDENLPLPGSRALRLGPEKEMESQQFCVFGVTDPQIDTGILRHIVRKTGTSDPEQPVVEIVMQHAQAKHCLIQLPRGFDVDDKTALEQHIIERTNDKPGRSYTSVDEMREKGVIAWGDPLQPVVVETATAPTYVFGDNVVLIGDAAMSCSPSSGLGAEIGVTVDSQNVRQLAIDLSLAGWDSALRDKALDGFNLRKAEASVIFSQGSRWFYITGKEANSIRESVQRRKNEVSAKANSATT